MPSDVLIKQTRASAPTDEFDLDIQLKASMWIATTISPFVRGCELNSSPLDTTFSTDPPSGGSGGGSGGSVNMKVH